MTPAATVTDALAALRDEDRFEERYEAEDVLRDPSPEDRGFLPELLRDFRDATSHGRFWIIHALERIAPQDPAVFAVIAEHSRDPDEQIRGEVIRYLGLYGDKHRSLAIPALAKAARLHPVRDFVSNSVKAFAALVRLVGLKEAFRALRHEKETRT